METSRVFIESKYQKGDFKVKSVIITILSLPETGVLRQKTDAEYIFFSQEKRERFLREMKKASGFTPQQLSYTIPGRNFVRQLEGRGAFASRKASAIHVESSYLKRKGTISTGTCRIEIRL